METVAPRRYEYKCLLCRQKFKSHVPNDKAKYMWNVFQRGMGGGKRQIRCPHCMSMYYIPYQRKGKELYRDTYKLFKYLDKYILDKDKGYSKQFARHLKKCFFGLKRCKSCYKFKSRITDFSYDHKTEDHLSPICHICEQDEKKGKKMKKILERYRRDKNE